MILQATRIGLVVPERDGRQDTLLAADDKSEIPYESLGMNGAVVRSRDSVRHGIAAR